jgi:hypothetical protein
MPWALTRIRIRRIRIKRRRRRRRRRSPPKILTFRLESPSV